MPPELELDDELLDDELLELLEDEEELLELLEEDVLLLATCPLLPPQPASTAALVSITSPSVRPNTLGFFIFQLQKGLC